MRSISDFVSRFVLLNQTTLIEDMIHNDLLEEESLYDIDSEVMEWWLVDGWLASRLAQQGEVIIETHGCHWWGRTVSGQRIALDHVVKLIYDSIC